MDPFPGSDAMTAIADVAHIKGSGCPALTIHHPHAGASSAIQPGLCLKKRKRGKTPHHHFLPFPGIVRSCKADSHHWNNCLLMAPFSSLVKPGSVIPDSEASATAGHTRVTLSPGPWNRICRSHSHMAQASLMTSGKESSNAPSLGQSYAHARVPLPHLRRCACLGPCRFSPSGPLSSV